MSRVKIFLPKIIADMIECAAIYYRQNQKNKSMFICFFYDSLSQLRLELHSMCERIAADGVDDSSEMLSVIGHLPENILRFETKIHGKHTNSSIVVLEMSNCDDR